LDPSPSARPRPPAAPTRVLILGGTSEATRLARALAAHTNVEATLSLAGRTATPPGQPLPTRIGGFGGVDGLVAFLRAERIDILVDATHPFAMQISQNARGAAHRAGCRLITVSRVAWSPQPGDRWQEVATMDAAAAALGVEHRRIFLTIGSLQLDAFRAVANRHYFLVRTIDPVSRHGFADASFIEAKGPFEADAEERLMRDQRIDVLVSKNSGGDAAVAKLTAARRLGLPVILVTRPGDDGDAGSVEQALAAIEAHGPSMPRGV
jgi:precorrin-6A/cobalt-precorrin-6A reductase